MLTGSSRWLIQATAIVHLPAQYDNNYDIRLSNFAEFKVKMMLEHL